MVDNGSGKNRLGRGLAALIGDDAAVGFGDDIRRCARGPY